MPRIISFAKTVDAMLEERKEVTRRDWKLDYWKSWDPGDEFKIYTRSPRNGGEQIGLGRIIQSSREQADLIKRDRKYGQKEARLEGFGDREDPLQALVDALDDLGISWDDQIMRVRFEILEVYSNYGEDEGEPDPLFES